SRRCSAASGCPAAASPSATARPTASARRAPTWRGPTTPPPPPPRAACMPAPAPPAPSPTPARTTPSTAPRTHFPTISRVALRGLEVYVPHDSPVVWGRGQSLQSPQGSQPPAARLAEAANGGRARDLVDGDRAPRRHRAPCHHPARAQRHRWLLARPIHSRHAPRYRSDRRGEERLRDFPRAGAAPWL